MEIEQKRDTLKSQLIALEKDHERLLKIHEQNKKQVDELARERDILNKNFLKVSSSKSITNYNPTSSNLLLQVSSWTWFDYTNKTRRTWSKRLPHIETNRPNSVKLYSSLKRKEKNTSMKRRT